MPSSTSTWTTAPPFPREPNHPRRLPHALLVEARQSSGVSPVRVTDASPLRHRSAMRTCRYGSPSEPQGDPRWSRGFDPRPASRRHRFGGSTTARSVLLGDGVAGMERLPRLAASRTATAFLFAGTPVDGTRLTLPSSQDGNRPRLRPGTTHARGRKAARFGVRGSRAHRFGDLGGARRGRGRASTLDSCSPQPTGPWY